MSPNLCAYCLLLAFGPIIAVCIEQENVKGNGTIKKYNNILVLVSSMYFFTLNSLQVTAWIVQGPQYSSYHCLQLAYLVSPLRYYAHNVG